MNIFWFFVFILGFGAWQFSRCLKHRFNWGGVAINLIGTMLCIISAYSLSTNNQILQHVTLPLWFILLGCCLLTVIGLGMYYKE